MAAIQPKRIPAPASGATIEEIEARAAEIRQAEMDALAALVACMREIATHCPPEGRLGLRLAKSSQTMDLWAESDGRQDLGVIVGVRDLCDALAHDWPDRMGDSEEE